MDLLGWKEDSSGSDDFELPESKHYPMDFRLAETRSQLEVRHAAEERKAQEMGQYLDRISQYRVHLTEAKSQPLILESPSLEDDSLNKSISNGRLKDPIQFILGGDNINWIPEDPNLRSSAYSKSQSQLNKSQSSIRSIPGLIVNPNPHKGPLPPPRKNIPLAGAMTRSQSTDAELNIAVADRASFSNVVNTTGNGHKAPMSRQATVISEDGTGSSSSEQSLALAQSNSPPFSQTDGNIEPKPRRRKIHFPFAKRSSRQTGNQS